MKKCDFCTELEPNGECFWGVHSNRRKYCEKAIEKMISVLSKQKENKSSRR